jgi:hypothetical protein
VHPPHHAVDVGVGRWRRGMDDERVVRLADEDPVEHERVEVDVEIERSVGLKTPTLSPSSSTPRPHPGLKKESGRAVVTTTFRREPAMNGARAGTAGLRVGRGRRGGARPGAPRSRIS